MTVFEKLQCRIKKDLDIDAVNFRRMYVGHWQKTGGAMIWIANIVIESKVTNNTIGSIYPATKLLKSKKALTKLSTRMGDYEILPGE